MKDDPEQPEWFNKIMRARATRKRASGSLQQMVMANNCIFPGCERDTGGLEKCFYHHMLTLYQNNRIVMNPQPMRDINEVTSDSNGRWGTFVMGKGMVEPFLNQPKHACGVQKDPKDGLWYWLIDS